MKKEIFNQIMSDVLYALYQPFWFALLFAIVFMYVVLHIQKCGLKDTVLLWLRHFKSNRKFRKIFFWLFIQWWFCFVPYWTENFGWIHCGMYLAVGHYIMKEVNWQRSASRMFYCFCHLLFYYCGLFMMEEWERFKCMTRLWQ